LKRQEALKERNEGFEALRQKDLIDFVPQALRAGPAGDQTGQETDQQNHGNRIDVQHGAAEHTCHAKLWTERNEVDAALSRGAVEGV
jgi:hypothetical protein